MRSQGRRLFIVVFLQIISPSMVAALPTPTRTMCPPPTPTPNIPSSDQLIQNDSEVAVTESIFGGRDRATVLSNYGAWATYDLVSTFSSFNYQLVSRGRVPNPGGYGVIGDPVAVTQPNGTRYLGSLAYAGVSPASNNAILVWSSTDGVHWANPVHVADYASGAGIVDKPWMAVSRLSGRLWLTWRVDSATQGPYCISTSLDGVTWSPCTTPAPGSGFISVAANGPDSAVALFEGADAQGNDALVASTCTASGLSVTCAPPVPIAPYFSVQSTDIIPNLRAGTAFTIAGDDSTGALMVVWGEYTSPTHARIVWSQNAGGGWTAPQPITGPTDDQLMPAVAYSHVAGEWFMTLYQRRGTTALFDVQAFEFQQASGTWQSLGPRSNPATPISATMNAPAPGAQVSFGDYSWIECPDDNCNVAYTGTNASTNNAQIEINAVPTLAWEVLDSDQDDTYVTNAAPTTNFGSATYIEAGRSPTTAKGGTPNLLHGLVHFQFFGGEFLPEMEVNSAVLWVDLSSVSGTPTLSIERMTQPFADSTATWNSPPQSSVSSVPTPVTAPITASSGWTPIGVTGLVRDCLLNQGGDCYWRISEVNETDNTTTSIVEFYAQDSGLDGAYVDIEAQ